MDLSAFRFTKTHEWATLSGDVCIVGISKFAADQLQDITYLKLPAVGAAVKTDAPFGEVETVKAVNDLYSPVTGEVTAVNTKVADNPESLKDDPLGSGWLIKVKLAAGGNLNHLLSPVEYETQVASEPH
ncbi:MAG: glycine cleavage system protein GcvH [Gemmataceae bacterium]